MLLVVEIATSCRRFFRSPFTQIKAHLIESNRSAMAHAAVLNFNIQMEPIYSERDNYIRLLDTDAHNSRTHCPSI